MEKRKIILVAEDDPLNFSLISNFLSKLDIDLLKAENGREAVALCFSNNVDLVLMDIRMPVMDGYTTTLQIKEFRPNLKIVAQTACAIIEEIETSNSWGRSIRATN